MRVMLADIEADALATAVQTLRDIGPDVRGVICDVADPASVERAASECHEAFGNVHVVCNNAGVGGHIVNTASMAGMLSGLGFSPYAASKFAVIAMSEGLALELAPLGIGVTVLCPGFVRTRISESARNHPSRYGPARTPDPASPAGKLAAHLAALGQSGLDPAHVAARTLTAIREDQLYVFTHPEMRAEATDRFATILAAMETSSVRPETPIAPERTAIPRVSNASSRL